MILRYSNYIWINWSLTYKKLCLIRDEEISINVSLEKNKIKDLVRLHKMKRKENRKAKNSRLKSRSNHLWNWLKYVVVDNQACSFLKMYLKCGQHIPIPLTSTEACFCTLGQIVYHTWLAPTRGGVGRKHSDGQVSVYCSSVWVWEGFWCEPPI